MLAVIVAVTAVVSVVFWPGQVNADSIGTYQDALAGHYSDWHSAVLTAGWRALMLAGLRSPGWVLAAGVLTLLVGLYLVLRARLARPWALLGAVAVLLFPPVLTFAVFLGTDSWFAAPIICGFGFAIRCARTRGASRAVSAALVVPCAFVAQAARPTAAPAVLALLCATALVLLDGRLGGWRHALGAAAAGAAGTAVLFGSVLVVQGPVLHAAALHPEQATYDYDLVALSIQERRVLLPPDVYARHDLAYLGAHSRGVSGFDISELLFQTEPAIPIPVEGERLASLRRAWMTAIRANPAGWLRVRAGNALAQLAITHDTSFVVFGAPPPETGLAPTFDPARHRQVMAYVGWGTWGEAVMGGPLERVWVYVLLLLAALVVCALRRTRVDAVLALFAASLLGYSLEIALFSPGIAYRYMYPAVTAATVLVVTLAGGAVAAAVRRAPAADADTLRSRHGIVP